MGVNFPMYYCWNAFLCAVSALPAIGLWSAAWERQLNSRDQATVTYILNALWHAANMVPILDLPKVMNQPEPPLQEWGLQTSLGLLTFEVLILGSLFLLGRLLFEHYVRAGDRAERER